MMMAHSRGVSWVWKKNPHDPGRSGPSCWSVPQATDDEFDGLLAWLREEGVEGYPPILGLSGKLIQRASGRISGKRYYDGPPA